MSRPDGPAICAARLLADGLLGHADQVAVARESVSGLDRGHAQRAVDLTVLRGLSVRLLPDRGHDISAACWDGIPLAWESRVAEVRARPTDARGDWIRAVGGGLVTTCGLQNVGSPSEGHGQHGANSSTPASSVHVEREVVGDELRLVVSGVIEECDALDTSLECRLRAPLRHGRRPPPGADRQRRPESGSRRVLELWADAEAAPVGAPAFWRLRARRRTGELLPPWPRRGPGRRPSPHVVARGVPHHVTAPHGGVPAVTRRRTS